MVWTVGDSGVSALTGNGSAQGCGISGGQALRSDRTDLKRETDAKAVYRGKPAPFDEPEPKGMPYQECLSGLTVLHVLACSAQKRHFNNLLTKTQEP